jgi:hypothetical protein
VIISSIQKNQMNSKQDLIIINKLDEY